MFVFLRQSFYETIEANNCNKQQYNNSGSTTRNLPRADSVSACVAFPLYMNTLFLCRALCSSSFANAPHFYINKLRKKKEESFVPRQTKTGRITQHAQRQCTLSRTRARIHTNFSASVRERESVIPFHVYIPNPHNKGASILIRE